MTVRIYTTIKAYKTYEVESVQEAAEEFLGTNDISQFTVINVKGGYFHLLARVNLPRQTNVFLMRKMSKDETRHSNEEAGPHHK